MNTNYRRARKLIFFLYTRVSLITTYTCGLNAKKMCTVGLRMLFLCHWGRGRECSELARINNWVVQCGGPTPFPRRTHLFKVNCLLYSSEAFIFILPGCLYSLPSTLNYYNIVNVHRPTFCYVHSTVVLNSHHACNENYAFNL